MNNGLGELWDFGITDEPFPMDIPDPLTQAPATNEEAGFWTMVQQFREKADEFWTAYKRLEELEPIAMQTPDTAASYNDVMRGGSAITSIIEGAADKIRGAIGWAGNLFGVDVVNQAKNAAFRARTLADCAFGRRARRDCGVAFGCVCGNQKT